MRISSKAQLKTKRKGHKGKVEYYKSIYGSPVGNADYEENFSLTLMPS